MCRLGLIEETFSFPWPITLTAFNDAANISIFSSD